LKYRTNHPYVTFSLHICTRQSAIEDLKSFRADIALVYDPEIGAEFNSLCVIPQPLHVQFHQSHPIADVCDGELRLSECLNWPLAISTIQNGVRYRLEQAALRSSLTLNVAVESDNFYFLRRIVEQGELISFTVPAGLNVPNDTLLHRPLQSDDVSAGMLHIATLRNRHLPVAAAKIADQLMNSVS